MAYHLEVKPRGPYPAPWKWEIYQDGNALWVERSMDSFFSSFEAEQAGRAALERLEIRRSLWRD
jgi:hypothetical protein